ncbi:MAG TPA: DUF4157 domain-containing protein, partial [Polyangia bacterium]
MSGFDSSYRPGASRGSSGTEAAGGDAVAEMRMRAAQHRRIIQRKAEVGAGAGDQTSAAPPTGGSTAQLPGPLRTKLEAQFQADFSEVQIHTGPEANASAKAVGARAYTTGHDLYFADGAYDPGSAAGQELIAHELTHVVQQKQGAVQAAVQHKSEVSQPGDPAELEADRVAAQVVAGRSVSVGAAPSAAVHLKRGGAAAVAEPEEEAEEEQQEEAAPEAPAPEAEAEAGAEPEAAPVEEPANADPRIAAVEAEAQVLAPEVAAELGPQMQNEPVARAYQALMAPEAEANAEALPQPEAAPEPPAAAAPPKSRWQRFKSAVGGAASAVGAAASSAGKSIKKAFTFSKAEKAKLGNDVKDTAKLGVSVGKVAMPVAKLGGEALQGSATLASH